MRSTSRNVAVAAALLFASLLFIKATAVTIQVKVHSSYLRHRDENPQETLQTALTIDWTGRNLTSWRELQGNLTSTVEILNVSSNSLNEIVFTQAFEKLQTLTCSNASLSQLKVNATSLKTLIASNNRLASFKNIVVASAIEELDLSENQLSDGENFKVPQNLQFLNFSHNAIENITGWDLSAAANLVSVDLSSNNLTSVVGVIFPKSLTTLDLSNNSIKTFEIRETDVAVLSNLDLLKVSDLKQSSCPTSGARTTTIGNIQVCVVSDTKFQIAYFRTERALGCGDFLILMSVIVSFLVSLWFVVLLTGHTIKRHRRSAKPNNQQCDAVEITSITASRHWSLSREEDLPNDVRLDPEFASLRIESSDVMQVRTLAHGSFAMLSLVYLGDKPAVVKKISIYSQSQDRDQMTAFMDEIRVCADLEHPKLIGFLGIMWTSLLDLAAVVEYAPNGNLAEYLKEKHRSRKSSLATFAWMKSSSEFPSKLSFALQASEAFVYLHSFAPSIIHGHLKAESLMLGSGGEVKLDRIGYRLDPSSLTIIDRAWTAPEVLASGKYDEKSDVYSFGMVLLELDRCKLPFSQEDLRRRSVDGTALKSKFRKDCPPEILEIAQNCLKDDPVDRPTAMKLYDSLQLLAPLKP